MEELCSVVSGDKEGMRLNRYIRNVMGVSNTSLRKLKFSGGIYCNDINVHTGLLLKQGDRVSLIFSDKESRPIKPYPIHLCIPYEDDHLYVISKPFGLPSVASGDPESMTLENALYAHEGCRSSFIYRPVNRLDKGTGGLMVVAKNPHVQYRLQKQLHTDQFVRRYLAVTDGTPVPKEGLIDLPILDPAEGSKRIISAEGKPSRTHYRVLREGSRGKSLIQLKLDTGRTHQIRVHLAAIGTPITGDYVYGSEREDMRGFFALFSKEVIFIHPITGAQVTVTDAPDTWFEALL